MELAVSQLPTQSLIDTLWHDYINTLPVGILMLLTVFLYSLYSCFKPSQLEQYQTQLVYKSKIEEKTAEMLERSRMAKEVKKEPICSQITSKLRKVIETKQAEAREERKVKTAQGKRLAAITQRSGESSSVTKRRRHRQEINESLIYITKDERRALIAEQQAQKEREKRWKEEQIAKQKAKQERRRQEEQQRKRNQELQTKKREQEAKLKSQKQAQKAQQPKPDLLKPPQGEAKQAGFLFNGTKSINIELIEPSPKSTSIGTLNMGATGAFPTVVSPDLRQTPSNLLSSSVYSLNNSNNEARTEQLGSTLLNIPTIPQSKPKQQESQSEMRQPEPPRPQPQNVSPPQPSGPSFPSHPIPAVRVNPPPSAPSRSAADIGPQAFLESYITNARTAKSQANINIIMANIGGARSSLKVLLIENRSFINSINKADDKQLTTFALKVFDGILGLIGSTNLRNGLYRIPPKSKTEQSEKNSINCYILHLNLYRLMGYEKVWAIVFGKLLNLLDFTYKRKEDIKSFEELDLLKNGHLDMRGQIEEKYLSRLDYLTYWLFGMTAFDPLLVFRQVEEQDPQVRVSREEIEGWGRQWNFNEFWILAGAIFSNKHDSYFKPVLMMNMLSAMYPRIRRHKRNPSEYKHEFDFYRNVIAQAKTYFQKYKNIQEVKNLSGSKEGPHYEYDGMNFKQVIKTLESRICNEKSKEILLSEREFEAKANVFYYFAKQQ